MKQFKSAYKNYHHLNPLYTSYQYCNSNTTTHHSHNIHTSCADQTFYCSTGTWVWPTRSISLKVTTLFNGDLSMSAATHLLPFMPTVWIGKAFTVLLFCHPTLRTAVKAVRYVGWPQGKSSLLNCFTNSRCLQLMWHSSWCSEQRILNRQCHNIWCLTGNSAYCYIQYMLAHTWSESHNIQLQTHTICTHHNTTNTVTYNIM